MAFVTMKMFRTPSATEWATQNPYAIQSKLAPPEISQPYRHFFESRKDPAKVSRAATQSNPYPPFPGPLPQLRKPWIEVVNKTMFRITIGIEWTTQIP